MKESEGEQELRKIRWNKKGGKGKKKRGKLVDGMKFCYTKGGNEKKIMETSKSLE